MYFVGFLFGLSFDTATEVSLLAVSAGAAAKGLPLLAHANAQSMRPPELAETRDIMGFIIVAAFIVTWIAAFTIRNTRRIEERWGSMVKQA